MKKILLFLFLFLSLGIYPMEHQITIQTPSYGTFIESDPEETDTDGSPPIVLTSPARINLCDPVLLCLATAFLTTVAAAIGTTIYGFVSL